MSDAEVLKVNNGAVDAGPHLGEDKVIPSNPIQALANTLVPVLLPSHWSHLGALQSFT